MQRTNKNTKEIAFINGRFVQKTDTDTIDLGTIHTRNGKLTRKQKLKIIAANGEFVKI